MNVGDLDPEVVTPDKLSDPAALAADMEESMDWLRGMGSEPYASSVFERGYWIRFRDPDQGAFVKVVLYDIGLACSGKGTTESAVDLVYALCVSTARVEPTS